MVLALGSSRGRHESRKRVVPLLGEDALYADLNAGTPATKKQLAALFAGGVFVDVASLQQDRVPSSLVTGCCRPGARRLIELFEPV